MAQGREAWLLSLEEEREKELSCRKLGEGTSRPSSKPKEAPPPPLPPNPTPPPSLRPGRVCKGLGRGCLSRPGSPA